MQTSKFYIAGMGIFDLFCSCDLDLDPMTFIYEPDSYSLEIYRMCKYELPTLRLRESYRLTDRQTDTTEIIYHEIIDQSINGEWFNIKYYKNG